MRHAQQTCLTSCCLTSLIQSYLSRKFDHLHQHRQGMAASCTSQARPLASGTPEEGDGGDGGRARMMARSAAAQGGGQGRVGRGRWWGGGGQMPALWLVKHERQGLPCCWCCAVAAAGQHEAVTSWPSTKWSNTKWSNTSWSNMPDHGSDACPSAPR
jgi:hypothetical protein